MKKILLASVLMSSFLSLAYANESCNEDQTVRTPISVLMSKDK